MPTPASLPFTSFTDAEGLPLANGYVTVRLSRDAQVTDLNFQLCAGITVKLLLDNSGSITGSGNVFFYPNEDLLPAGTFYLVEAFTNAGQKVFSEWITVTSGGTEGFGVAFGVSFAS